MCCAVSWKKKMNNVTQKNNKFELKKHIQIKKKQPEQLSIRHLSSIWIWNRHGIEMAGKIFIPGVRRVENTQPSFICIRDKPLCPAGVVIASCIRKLDKRKLVFVDFFILCWVFSYFGVEVKINTKILLYLDKEKSFQQHRLIKSYIGSGMF